MTSGQSAMAAQVLPQSGYVTSHKPSARPQCPALRVTYCFSTRVPLPMLQEPLKLEIARVGAHCGLQMSFFDSKIVYQKEPSYRLKQAGDILGIQFSLLRGAEEPLSGSHLLRNSYTHHPSNTRAPVWLCRLAFLKFEIQSIN